jgi:hypothetical protein
MYILLSFSWHTQLPHWKEGIEAEIFDILDEKGPYLSAKYEVQSLQ